MNDFVVHACEQVLRFTTVEKWGNLPESRKVQLSFNLGVVALGLGLTKAEGYDFLAATEREEISVSTLHKHFRQLITKHKIDIREENVTKPF